MSSPWHSLLKKLHSVKDLKEAITHVKKSGLMKPAEVIKKDENGGPVVPKPASNVDASPTIVDPTQHATQPAAPAQAPAPVPKVPPVQLLGRNQTQSGHTIFHIGHPGSDTYYELDMDLHAKRKGLPAFTVSHKKASGQLLDRHATTHNTMESATKAIAHHNHNKVWK